MKEFLKKIKRHLQLWDVFWSLPLAFVGFWLVGLILTSIFGYSVGTYDLGFIQPLFISAAIVIGSCGFGLGFVWFYARGLFYYFYGRTVNGVRIQECKDDFNALTPLQRILLFFFVLFTPILIIIFVFIHFI